MSCFGNTYSKTHIGKRELNEDALFADAEQGLAIVADGMGGHAAGEVASQLATDAVVSGVQQKMGLAESLVLANNLVLEAANEDGRKGMGTTLVVANDNGHTIELAWLGDSRAYLWHKTTKTLWRLTRDHSKVEHELQTGAITPTEARYHPERNIVTLAVGVMNVTASQVATRTVALGQDQLLILCSDGLTDALRDVTLAQLCDADVSVEDVLDDMVSQALIAGGSDNITVVICEPASDALPGVAPENPVSSARPDGAYSYFKNV